MLTKTRIVCVSLCAVSLTACMSGGQPNYGNYQPYDYQTTPLYPEGYDNTVVYSSPYDTRYESKQDVVVPESYHVGAYQSPTPSKDLDKNWVNSQNPMGYTIQIADDEKASHVASTLQKAPKSEHMAEVKYQRDGKAYYKGLYGTYPNYDAASKALGSLPDDVKQNAGIKTWGSVQQNVTE